MEGCPFCNGIGEVAESPEEEQQRLTRQAEFQRKNDELTAQRLERLQQRKRAGEEEMLRILGDEELIARELHISLLMLRISSRSLRDLMRGDNDNYRKLRMIGEQLTKMADLTVCGA